MRFLTLVALPMLLAAPASDQVQLRFKFTPGQVIRQKMTQEMNSAATVQGRVVNTSIRQTMYMEQMVESVESDGSAKIRQKISRIQMSMKAPFGQEFEFDSAEEDAGEAAPPVAKTLGKLAGTEFQARILPTGKLTDVEIPEDLVKAFQSIPGSPFGSGGKDMLKEMVGKSSITFPEQAVARGDSWSDENTMKMPFGEMKFRRTNTYDGANDDGLHVIAIDIDLELVPSENQAVQMKFKDSDAEGTMLFDPSQGQLVRSEMVQNMTLEVAAAGQMFEQKIEQKVTIEQLSGSEE